jgi:rhodanese-related sulfurtransferase|uniref:Rhodanese domain-containing protein n=1 Tax=viral metagenome TaxID=1070528 RepID=A0A6C0CJ57_9ZZZZ
MGNQTSIQRINFEDIQETIKDNKKNILINTLPSNLQDCLIPNTINIDQEENLINNLLKTDKSTTIIIYGKNVNDITVYDKYEQLIKLGFSRIYIYPGGIFEWLCLQDIYSSDNFPTTKKQLDILKYKPISVFNKLYLTDGLD